MTAAPESDCAVLVTCPSLDEARDNVDDDDLHGV